MIDLVSLAEGIAVKIAAEGSTANVVFGRGHLIRQDNQGEGTANRVVVAPGDPDGGGWGEIRVPTKVPAPNPQVTPAEAIHGELVTVDVWGYDAEDPSDERLQYRALRALWQPVARAIGALIREGGHTSTWWGSTPELLSDPRDRRHGERCRIVFAIDFSVRAPTPAQAVTAEAAPPEALVEP